MTIWVGSSIKWNKIGKFCGKELPNTIVANDTVKITFISDKEQGGKGFKISFSISFDPGMLMNLPELEHLDGLRVLYQDLYSLNVDGKTKQIF